MDGIGYIHSFWMATPGVCQVPELIVKVANERSKPFLRRSAIAGMGKANVHRMTWHSLSHSGHRQFENEAPPSVIGSPTGRNRSIFCPAKTGVRHAAIHRMIFSGIFPIATSPQPR